MAIVTGDRYLEHLVKFVEKEAGSLVDGTTVLKLNPVGLHYVHTRFEALHELEGLLDGAPVDYLRAYVSDLGDHRALEQLRRMLRILPSLKVVSVIPYPARDPTPLSLVPFGCLRVLELRCCDLSTSAAKGLLELRPSLEKIVCYNSTDALRHVLASRIAEIKNSPQWRRLNYVSFACNRLVLMDESLQLLPSIDTLDLSRNRFAKVDNLHKCTKLKNLDLGFNNLRTILPLREISCNLVQLIIRNNALSSLRGLENLKSLEGLDVSFNIVSSFSELEYISGLHNLQNLWLEGNPLCCSRWYRAHVFSFFPHPGMMKLDGKEIGTREFWKRQIIIASTFKVHSSYGFYLPAKENSSDKEGALQKKRKVTRLASIESDDGSTSAASDEESVSYDHQKENKEFLSDDKTDVDSLMSTVELMKKDSTIHWLRGFRNWIKYKSGLTVDPSSRNETLREVTAPTPFDAFNSYKIDPSAKKNGNYLQSPTERTNSSVRGKLRFDHLTKPSAQDVSLDFQKIRKDQNCNRLVEERSDFAELEASSNCSDEPLTAVNRKNKYYRLRSPPHYQEDVLQKRHNLGNEICQASLHSQSIGSSDSNNTSSEDESDARDGCPFTYADSWSKHCESFSSSAEGNETEGGLTCTPYKQEEVNYNERNGEGPGDHIVNKQGKSRKNLISLEEHRITTDRFHVNVDGNICGCEGFINLESNLPGSFHANLLTAGVVTATAQSLVSECTIEEYFKLHIGDSNVNETCRDYVHCDCILEPQSLFREREVIIMVSDQKKLYVLLISIAFDGSGHLILRDVLKIEDVQEILVGFGLQVIRIFISKGATYLFRTGSLTKSRHLLSLLDILDGSKTKQVQLLKSLEHIQMNLFEKEICHGLTISVFQYSLVHFVNRGFEDEPWRPRSLFIAGGQLLICVEDFRRFSSSLSASFSPYYSLDSCCFIGGISELVVDTRGCLATLAVERSASKCNALSKDGPHQSETLGSKGPLTCDPLIWKLKWYSEDGLTNFITLLKAIHTDLSSAALVVRYVS